MSQTSVTSRSGQILATGDSDALFLKKFANEVLTTFEDTNVMLPLTKVKDIESGKSFQFPIMGKAAASYHTVGDNLLDSNNSYLNTIKHEEKLIAIDDILLSPIVIPELDVLKNHYSVRADYSKELGRALAVEVDTNLIKTVVAAARSAANISGDTFAGGQISVSNSTDPDTLTDALVDAARIMDEKDVPMNDRVCILAPEQWHRLRYAVVSGAAKVGVIVNRDYGGGGSLASGASQGTLQVAGIWVYMSNHIPTTDLSAVAAPGVNNDVFGADGIGYNGDFAVAVATKGTTLGIVFQKEAIGTVKRLDFSVQHDYRIELQGDLLVARTMVGHGVLRPECAIELYNESA